MACTAWLTHVDLDLFKNMLEAAKRRLAKPIRKKEPVSLEMITRLCENYAGDNSTLSDLRVAAMCVTAFHAVFEI